MRLLMNGIGDLSVIYVQQSSNEFIVMAETKDKL